MRRGLLAAVACVVTLLVYAAPASAGGWLPHPTDATWTYQWTDSVYAPKATIEKVTVADGADAKAFKLKWSTDGMESPSAITSNGTVSFQETTAGLINTDWTSNPPPPEFPVLCARLLQCANSLTSAFYLVIWGSNLSTVFAEPLLRGTTWASSGGAAGDVATTSTYQGVEQITVPAFKDTVVAAKVRSEITQAGALGDPYGSGVRTVWWVYGVGPVKIEFQHAGGADAPITTAELQSTSLTPQMAPSDLNYFPLVKGEKHTYSYTNTKHLTKPSVQTFTTDEVANGAARFGLKVDKFPIRVVGSYGFSLRLDGLNLLYGQTKAATVAKFPPLGPRALPKDQRRNFFTVYDLMTYGLNPLLPAYPKAGDTWAAKNPSREYSIFGVTGSSRVVGIQTVKVPAGKFQALVVASSLTQDGFPYGSGTRTLWFVPDKGLVKLVFRHRDGSVSTAELVK